MSLPPAFFKTPFSPEAEGALRQRLSVALRSLSPQSPSSEKKLDSLLQDLISDLTQRFASSPEALGILLLVLRGHYTLKPEWETLFFQWKIEFQYSLASFLEAHAEFLYIEIEKAKWLEFTPPLAFPQFLWIDVTFTHSHSRISGVQRVVRQIVSEWHQAFTPFFLLHLSHPTLAEVFDEAEMQAFLHFETHRPRPTPSQFTSFASTQKREDSLFYAFVKVSYHWLLKGMSQGAKTFPKLRFLESKLFQWKESLLEGKREQWVLPSLSKKTKVPFLWNTDLALLEVVHEPARVEFYFLAMEQTPFRFSMVFYDLIPLYFPEFCAESKQFTTYLRLLQLAGRISCISSDVEKQLLSFFQPVPRKIKGECQIRTHALTGDLFSSSSSHVPSPSGTAQTHSDSNSVPILLCVGTVEARKNQVRVLRAAITLWENKLSFRLTFVGSRGWLCDDFLKTFSEAKARSYPVSWLQTAADAELHSLYQAAHFSLFISFAEGFGLPILESLKFKKPCIVSERGCMKELAEEGGCLLVDPSSVDSIATAIQTLLTNKGCYETLQKQIEQRHFKTGVEYSKELIHFFKG